jgi:hypothetical protein
MAKRSIEEVLDDVRKFKSAGLSTFQAMAASMDDREWDDLVELIDRLQRFWKQHDGDPLNTGRNICVEKMLAEIVRLQSWTERLQGYNRTQDAEIERLLAERKEAIAAERERCAKIAEHLNGWGSSPNPELVAHIAKIIREN